MSDPKLHYDSCGGMAFTGEIDRSDAGDPLVHFEMGCNELWLTHSEAMAAREYLNLAIPVIERGGDPLPTYEEILRPEKPASFPTYEEILRPEKPASFPTYEEILRPEKPASFPT